VQNGKFKNFLPFEQHLFHRQLPRRAACPSARSFISASEISEYGYAESPSVAFITTKDTKGENYLDVFCLCDLRVLRGEIISDVSNWSFPDNRVSEICG
jgi:hypothetical protein